MILSDINKQIATLTSSLNELIAEKNKIENDMMTVVSEYELSTDLESIAGWICQVNKKDYFVQIFDSSFGNGSYLILSEGGIDFCGNDIGEPYSDGEEIVTAGRILNNPCQLHSADFILIPIPEEERDTSWFISKFRWTENGYVIEKVPVNSNTGEVQESLINKFN